MKYERTDALLSIGAALTVVLFTALITSGSIGQQAREEQACAWAERSDMYDECAQAFDARGQAGADKLRASYALD